METGGGESTMDAGAQAQAMALLGRFSDELTRAFDDALGTQWAEIEDILAIAAVVSERGVTTRRLADISGLDRRAVSRMIARLRSEGLVFTRPSHIDGRAVEVVLTARGERRSQVLRASITDFFRGSGERAQEIVDVLQSADGDRVPADPADAMDLLRRVCQAGVALVGFMPDSTTQGRLAARQRAALVQIVIQGEVRPNDLGPSLAVSRAGVAYIVDQLCTKGLVSRRRDALAGDRRAVVLDATAEGAAAVRAVMDGIEHQRDELALLFTEIALWRAPVEDAAPSERRR